MQPGRAAHGGRVPGIARARGQHARRPGRRGDAHDRADVAEVARILEQHGGTGPERGRVERRAPRDRHDARVVRARAEHGGVHRLHAGEVELGRERGGEPGEPVRVAGRRRAHLGAEAQRVLERVEAVEHDQRRIRARARPAAPRTRPCQVATTITAMTRPSPASSADSVPASQPGACASSPPCSARSSDA